MNGDLELARNARERLWRDPHHWEPFGIYRCADDPRLFVPARRGLGWTVNMGHRRAQTVLWSGLAVIIAFVVGLALVVAHAT